jgi:membrane-bound inhibitor of C-type lysozyme
MDAYRFDWQRFDRARYKEGGMQDWRNAGEGDRRAIEGGLPAAPRLRVVGLVLILTAGCAGVDVERTVYPAELAYDCRDGKTMQVARAPDGRSATVRADGKTVTLSRADSAAEEKYTDGTFVLYLDRERALLEQNGKVLFGACQSQAVLPTAPRRNY